jgi:hypothetical protein
MIEYKAEMRQRACDEWAGQPDFWCRDEERVRSFVRNGRFDFDGGMWRMLERRDDGTIRVMWTDNPPPPGLTERLFIKISGHFERLAVKIFG